MAALEEIKTLCSSWAVVQSHSHGGHGRTVELGGGVESMGLTGMRGSKGSRQVGVSSHPQEDHIYYISQMHGNKKFKKTKTKVLGMQEVCNGWFTVST